MHVNVAMHSSTEDELLREGGVMELKIVIGRTIIKT